MATIGTYKTGSLVSVLSGVIMTAVLFLALPLLTRIHQNHQSTWDRAHSVLLISQRPPPPPPEDRDRPKEQELVQKEIQKTTRKAPRARPKFDIPKVTLAVGAGGIGGIEIGVVTDFKVSGSLFMSAFNPTEVDQPPRAIRTFPPQYPYLARRDSIEGRVVLKFVVDTDGIAKEAKVETSTPEGIFEDAALKALGRYRFKPAIKDGKAVLCVVRLPISFRLD